ncbi:acyltransferase family protein [Streptomyces xiaopingdaonensis]|uniref:acyltransferase family protein n=1 Tax=Streptomyces xiaopingdaonensis TaxID=1565415 RepID=UPI0002EC3BC4|nr:acyltransferase [Streptomyces xiaopingdaonensis]
MADVRAALARIEAATPPDRDRAVDGLRALALCSVPAGHWLLGGFVREADGALRNASPLGTLGFLAPLSWGLQLLGVFFLVGGYASALSLRRCRDRGETVAEWLGSRLLRLGRPVLGVAAVWAALVPVLSWLGVPGATLRTAAVLVVQPLWFVGVYAAVTALTPWCLRAARRYGVWSAVVLCLPVAAVDAVRYGPLAEAAPEWLGLLNLLPGWLFGYQLGVVWRERGLDGRACAGLVAGGGVLFAVLLWRFDYPASMVGVPGQQRTNSHPPSLLVPALAAVQGGLAVLLRAPLGRLLARPALWSPTAVLNLAAMTVLCWHQSALLALALPGAAFGVVPGLTEAPFAPGWVLARLAWLPVLVCTLVVLGRLTHRFEPPWRGTGRAHKAMAGALAFAFALYAFAVV